MALDRITLENQFLRLEPIEEAHREPLRLAGNDPDLWRFAYINQYAQDFDAWIDNRLKGNATAGDMTFAIFEKKSQFYVGSSSYLAVSTIHKRLEVGWTWYAKSVWSTAVNPACKLLMLQHAFEALQFNRVEFKLDATNARSWKAVEKIGAKHEGVHRAHMVMPEGRIRDSAFFSITRDEWPDVKKGLERRLDAFTANA
ncbi:MAG: GNAT family protein [Pseudomonadota bacterium]